MEVESGCDVGDDASVIGAVNLEVADLSFEVACLLLLGARNASIEDCLSIFTFFNGGPLSEGASQVLFMVAMRGGSIGAESDGPDLALLGPSIEREPADSVALMGYLRSDVLVVQGSFCIKRIKCLRNKSNTLSLVIYLFFVFPPCT